jgi:hypothetical protein
MKRVHLITLPIHSLWLFIHMRMLFYMLCSIIPHIINPLLFCITPLWKQACTFWNKVPLGKTYSVPVYQYLGKRMGVLEVEIFVLLFYKASDMNSNKIQWLFDTSYRYLTKGNYFSWERKLIWKMNATYNICGPWRCTQGPKQSVNTHFWYCWQHWYE